MDIVSSEREEYEDGLTMNNAQGGIELLSGGRLEVDSTAIDVESGDVLEIFISYQKIEYVNFDTNDGFEFRARHDPDTGELLASFVETGRIKARTNELLADPEFTSKDELPSALITPRFEVTPSDEIDENGVEASMHARIGEVGVSVAFFYDNEKEAAGSQARAVRRLAAIRQAESEFNSDLTEEHAQRLPGLIDDIR